MGLITKQHDYRCTVSNDLTGDCRLLYAARNDQQSFHTGHHVLRGADGDVDRYAQHTCTDLVFQGQTRVKFESLDIVTRWVRSLVRYGADLKYTCFNAHCHLQLITTGRSMRVRQDYEVHVRLRLDTTGFCTVGWSTEVLDKA